MNKHKSEGQKPTDAKGQKISDSNDTFEAHIARVLHEQASHIHFSTSLRNQILQRLSSPHKTNKNTLRLPTLAFAVALAVILALLTYTIFIIHPPQPKTGTIAIQFGVDKEYATPPQLAHNGQLVSIDPTGQHIVYGITDQPGVMYTTDLSDPLAKNMLAMRDARDVAWAPDGSSLVTTIYPHGTYEPLLALVPTGKYMYLLGHDALAASWQPTSPQEITYVTQEHGQTQLWTTPVTGHGSHIIATMQVSMLAQHIAWSPDGRLLALLVTTDQTPSQQALNGPGRAIYIMDAQTKELREVVAPGDFTIGSLTWSLDGHILTYTRSDVHDNKTTLYAFDTIKHASLFSIPLRHTLEGANWSPDSRILLYSDGGVLQTHVLYGTPVQLPKFQSSAAYPIWLDAKHILCMQITNGVGQLTQLITK